VLSGGGFFVESVFVEKSMTLLDQSSAKCWHSLQTVERGSEEREPAIGCKKKS